jgi:hypothetical protein
LITDALYNEVRELPPNSASLTRLVQIDVIMYRRELSELFPDLAIEVPAASLNPAVPVFDTSSISQLLQELVSVNQTMLAQQQQPSSLTRPSKTLSKSQSKSTIDPSNNEDPSRVKLQQALKVLDKSTDFEPQRQSTNSIDYSQMRTPSMDLKHQMNMKRAVVEQKLSSQQKSRKSRIAAAKHPRSAQRKSESTYEQDEADHELSHDALDDEETETDTDPDLRMGDSPVKPRSRIHRIIDDADE